MPFRPDYLVIGHITKDLYNGGYKIGGTATFSALTARNLGYRVGIVSSNGPDIDLSHLPADIEIRLRQCGASTTFQNIYEDGHRRQHIGAQADVLHRGDIPEQWHTSPIVHLGPIAQEIDNGVFGCFPNALLGLTPQGWMRAWDERGMVHPIAWDPPDELLQRADTVILSREDVGEDMDLVQSYADRTRILVLTAGWKGSTVHHGGQKRVFPAPRVTELDPTGAGDIYAAAYLTALHRSSDPWFAAQFANCVAAHSVERSGMDSIPTEQEIAWCRSQFGDRI
jgi:sugar/nucleoside kinase (ribokinase family)